MTHSEYRELDNIDRAILRELQSNSRISNADLARRVHLSPPAVHARVRRMETDGLIRQYATLVDPEQAGFDMLCFVFIGMQLHNAEQLAGARAMMRAMPEVMECYHLTGEFDYLLKVVIQNRKALERFVVDRLTPLPGVARIQTSMVLTEVKYSTHLPLN